ncbi:alkaline D-peptidase. Serine peptidase. MEROPS family S12 [Lentzea xinjiangensis]|uniref:Alkaline D-peptidase. Serine peptidase. MEROPS family S12 n=1 Tax=Lentzea xinjiangensis TaxID=402600 RepID=A0A1H9FC15_9PSEU|nr:serine hydrolase domain-containing protein [Lentzea xinjiangensis]SEQ35476.1 alkaline D-peptidase. Serine peptidase. MEROPS family S12 [Lentzea xinjiangensis]
MSLPARSTTGAARRRRGVVAAALAAVAVASLAATPVASAERSRPVHDKALQAGLEALVKDGTLPGALMSVRGRDGRVTNYTAGVGDIRTRSKVPTDGYVRIASSTKMFTAVAVLQLAGDGKLSLDDAVEKHLPGVVRGTGAGAAIDGRNITIRQLLNHTSGLTREMPLMPQGILPIRDRYFEARELLDAALAEAPTFAPGQDRVWMYSNAGYVLLGLVAQKAAGRPLAEVITNQIINRAGLEETYYPGPGDRDIRAPHPRGYLFARNDKGEPIPGELVDITRFDPSIAGAAGQMIATPSDVNKFLVALQDGRLLKPRQLAEMRQAIEAPGFPAGWRYGLGTIEMKLSCGVTAYGHGGDADGFQTRTAITSDGRAVTLAVTNDEAGRAEVLDFFDKALCAAK